MLGSGHRLYRGAMVLLAYEVSAGTVAQADEVATCASVGKSMLGLQHAAGAAATAAAKGGVAAQGRPRTSPAHLRPLRANGWADARSCGSLELAA